MEFLQRFRQDLVHVINILESIVFSQPVGSVGNAMRNPFP
jgi:hypothetical protein